MDIKFDIIQRYYLLGNVMTEDVLRLTCKVHGELESEYIYKQKNNAYKAGYILRCQKCIDERAWKYATFCKEHGKLDGIDIKSNGRCAICHRESANRKRDQNREWFNAKMAEDRLKNPEKWEERYKKAYKKALERDGSVGKVTKEILRVHNLTHARYEQMINEQGNLCAICRQPETRKSRTPGKITRLVVDHCHETNEVRGLLCHSCNLMIGYARDSKDILELGILYLQEFEDKSQDIPQ